MTDFHDPLNPPFFRVPETTLVPLRDRLKSALAPAAEQGSKDGRRLILLLFKELERACTGYPGGV